MWQLYTSVRTDGESPLVLKARFNRHGPVPRPVRIALLPAARSAFEAASVEMEQPCDNGAGVDGVGCD